VLRERFAVAPLHELAMALWHRLMAHLVAPGDTTRSHISVGAKRRKLWRGAAYRAPPLDRRWGPLMARQFRSLWTTTLAMFRWTKTSPG